jgi:hypothetical protein
VGQHPLLLLLLLLRPRRCHHCRVASCLDQACLTGLLGHLEARRWLVLVMVMVVPGQMWFAMSR